MSTNRTSNMPSGLDQQGRRQTRISAADPLFHGDHDTPTLLPGDTDGFGFQPAKGRPMPEWVARSHQALQRRSGSRSYPPVRTPGLLLVIAVYVGALAVVGWRLLVGGI